MLENHFGSEFGVSSCIAWLCLQDLCTVAIRNMLYIRVPKNVQMAIVEITSRQFRERQKDFFEMADKGEKVVIRRGRKQAYVLTPVSEDDLYFTPELIQRIKDAQQEIREGKCTVLNSKEEIDAFFKNLK